MKTILISFLLLTAGCSTQKNLTNLVKALAKDPATVNINLSTIYGTLRFERYMPGVTNYVATPGLWGAPMFLPQQPQPAVMQLAPAPGLFWIPSTNAVK